MRIQAHLCSNIWAHHWLEAPRRATRRYACRIACGVRITTLVAVYLLCSCQARCDWQDERQVGAFVFHADFDLEPIAPLLGGLRGLQRDVPRTLRLPETDQVIDVYLFAEESTYRQYVLEYFPSAPTRRAMFIKSRRPGNVFAYKSDRLAVDLRHECTHALLHAVLPYVPLWLDEGLAEYFEVSADERSSANPHMKAVRRKLVWRSVPSLKKLEAMTELSSMEHRQYRDAWAWVHFMIHGPPAARIAFNSYLNDIRHNVVPEKLHARLERQVPRTEQRFISHFRAWGS